MFEKNLKELEKKNPKLADKLKNYNLENITNIEVFEAESKDIIISYNGMLLHSGENPVREAKSVWHKNVSSDLGPKDIQIVYGLGLGYLFKRAYTNAPSRIMLCEPSLDILRFVLEYVDFSKEFAEDRVFVFNSQDELMNCFEAKYLFGDKIEVLFLPSYVNFEKDNLLKLSEEIYKVVKNKGVDNTTISRNAPISVMNIIKRIKNLEKFSAVDFLENKFADKTALVLSAGPSLKNDLKLIKQNKNKYITIAILPIVEILIENGIEPDFITVVDPWTQVHKIKNIKDKLQNTNFVVEARSDMNLDEIKSNSKTIYFSDVDKISEEILNSANLTSEIAQRNSVLSVAILSYELAKIIGCKNVVFSGLDLAIIDNKVYAKDTKSSLQGEHKILIESEAGDKSYYLTKVKSANGEEILTREDYLIFIDEFKNLAQKPGALKMYNTSEKGAYIEGMEYSSLSEISETITDKETDINATINKALETKQDLWTNFIKASQEFSAKQKELIEENKKLTKKVIKETEEIIQILSDKTPNLEKFQKSLNENSDDFSKLRRITTQNVLLSSSLQAQITAYIKNYKRDDNMDIPKLKANFETDLTLFNSVDKTNSAIISCIDDKK